MDDQIRRHISLKSKLARRIFILFVFCALIPLLIMSTVSYFFVTAQLKDQAYERLRQQCKNAGYEIYERLLFLEKELGVITRDYNRFRLQNPVKRPYNPQNREGSGFNRIFRVLPDGRTGFVLEHVEDLPPIAFKKWVDVDENRKVVIVQDKDVHFPHLYLKLHIPHEGMVIGEINPLYLWGIGTEGALPPDMDMEIRDLDGKILIASIQDHNLDKYLFNAFKKSSHSGRFESSQDGKAHINSYWSLFMGHRFSIPDWIIIFSQSKASVLSPVSTFSYVFILLILLTFMSVIMLCIHAIRRRTLPIEILKKGAMKIAGGEFGYQVTITSGDEFESLGETFNEMSVKVKKGQDMLMQAAKMSTFGQMAAGIVHEIGQPLSAINGYATVLRMEPDPQKHERYLKMIGEQTERLMEIITKFRTFSRTSKDVFTCLDVNEILDKTHSLLEHNLKIKRVRLEMGLGKGLPLISGDKSGLQQVFLNLMMNAMDALEEKSKEARNIRVKTFVDNGVVNVEISDNGCGIPEEIQQSIYDPFFTTKSEEKGTGLGLAIISSIIHKHNARIHLASTIDQGSCFTISFPSVPLDTGTTQPLVEQ